MKQPDALFKKEEFEVVFDFKSQKSSKSLSLHIITYHCLHKEKDVKENDKNKIGESF